MKKHFSSDKYKWLKEKSDKKFIPNLPSTDKLNEEAIRKAENQKYSHIKILPEIEQNNTIKNNKKMSVVVPYRDRKQHLEIFRKELPKVFESQGIEYQITIIEQDFGKLFNKAILQNIGFLETQEFDYFCFHDVDMIPIHSDYTLPISKNSNIGFAIHLSGLVEQFDFKRIPHYFGGVLLVDKVAFTSTNGYNNSYWGWGLEDDDFYRRCYENTNVVTIFRDGYYKSLNHTHNYSKNIYDKNMEVFSKKIHQDKDGIRQTKYKILSKIDLDDKTRIIKVSL